MRSRAGRVYRFVLRATAAFTSALNAPASTIFPSWMSIALRMLPSRLELKRCDGSGRLAPLANVSFTTLVYVSPVQTMPLRDQTASPLPLLDHLGLGFQDQRPHVGQGLAAPIPEVADALVDEPGSGFAVREDGGRLVAFWRLHRPRLAGGWPGLRACLRRSLAAGGLFSIRQARPLLVRCVSYFPPSADACALQFRQQASGQSSRNKSSKGMAFPHPEPRKEHYWQEDKPGCGRVIWNDIKRAVNVADYRNAADDVNPANDRTLGSLLHDVLLPC
jgi:hypothetical protein